MENIMIGLAMSTYNGEKYIEEQLESIKKQSMKVDHVIIIDDCSDDETYKIIKKFTENNGLNWIVQQNSKNLGWKSNFLKIIEMLEDDYIFFCDQDDIWDKDKVKKSIEAMKKKDADVLCTNYKLF